MAVSTVECSGVAGSTVECSGMKVPLLSVVVW